MSEYTVISRDDDSRVTIRSPDWDIQTIDRFPGIPERDGDEFTKEAKIVPDRLFFIKNTREKIDRLKKEMAQLPLSSSAREKKRKEVFRLAKDIRDTYINVCAFFGGIITVWDAIHFWDEINENGHVVRKVLSKDGKIVRVRDSGMTEEEMQRRYDAWMES